MSPYMGFCNNCNHTITAETKTLFGEELIKHHEASKGNMGGFNSDCSVFFCHETDKQEKPISKIFQLQVKMNMVLAELSETWYIRPRNKERL